MADVVGVVFVFIKKKAPKLLFSTEGQKKSKKNGTAEVRLYDCQEKKKLISKLKPRS